MYSITGRAIQFNGFLLNFQEVHPVFDVSVCDELQLRVCQPHDGIPLRPDDEPRAQHTEGEARADGNHVLLVWLRQQVRQ